jgi:hypothetical protein
MEKIYFMTLCPDDYHGAVQVREFTDEDFPMPLDRESIFNVWCEAGYNSYNMGEFESEEEAFELYGDSLCYYAAYMILFNASANIQSIEEIINEQLSEASSDAMVNEGALDVDDVCEIVKGISGVSDVVPIEFYG